MNSLVDVSELYNVAVPELTVLVINSFQYPKIYPNVPSTSVAVLFFPTNGSVTFVTLSHPLNAPSPIAVTELLTNIEVIEDT